MRAGVMIRGEVDATGPNWQLAIGWIDGCRIYLNGQMKSNVIGYDEDYGELIVRPVSAGGQVYPPQLLKGRVQAVPRSARF
jgi:hypothetical protein